VEYFGGDLELKRPDLTWSGQVNSVDLTAATLRSTLRSTYFSSLLIISTIIITVTRTITMTNWPWLLLLLSLLFIYLFILCCWDCKAKQEMQTCSRLTTESRVLMYGKAWDVQQG